MEEEGALSKPAFTHYRYGSIRKIELKFPRGSNISQKRTKCCIANWKSVTERWMDKKQYLLNLTFNSLLLHSKL